MARMIETVTHWLLLDAKQSFTKMQTYTDHGHCAASTDGTWARPPTTIDATFITSQKRGGTACRVRRNYFPNIVNCQC